jgi:hypothetical protein
MNDDGSISSGRSLPSRTQSIHRTTLAYKQMREIEAEINKRRGELDRKSEIPLSA